MLMYLINTTNFYKYFVDLFIKFDAVDVNII